MVIIAQCHFSFSLTCKCDEANRQAQQNLHVEIQSERLGFNTSWWTVTGRLAHTHPDGESGGAGQNGGTAVSDHHWKIIVCAIMLGEGAPPCQNASCVICNSFRLPYNYIHTVHYTKSIQKTWSLDLYISGMQCFFWMRRQSPHYFKMLYFNSM